MQSIVLWEARMGLVSQIRPFPFHSTDRFQYRTESDRRCGSFSLHSYISMLAAKDQTMAKDTILAMVTGALAADSNILEYVLQALKQKMYSLVSVHIQLSGWI